ncbi:hypothetical protein R1sor_018867 [Riccia sorocarpa]|uniref:Transposase n=1 Tax=Riccia sorocarpa TaxID=122646 RepID=A0ABD3IAW5_9MARC
MARRFEWTNGGIVHFVVHVTNEWSREWKMEPLAVRWQRITDKLSLDGIDCTWTQAKAKWDWVFRAYARIVDYEMQHGHVPFEHLDRSERIARGLPFFRKHVLSVEQETCCGELHINEEEKKTKDLADLETASEYGTSDVPDESTEWADYASPSSDNTGFFHNDDEADCEDCPCHIHRDLRGED